MKFVSKNKNLFIALIVLLLASIIIYLVLSDNKSEDIKFNIDNSFLRDYQINEVVPVYVTDEDLARSYLAEYVNLLLYDRQKAYELLDVDIKEESFETFDIFDNYVNNIITPDFLKMKVVKYKIVIEKNQRLIYVVDYAQNTFTFIENSLMDYQVSI